MVNHSVKSSVTTRGVWLCLALFLLHAAPVLAARIEVSLDRNPVPLNESFTLIFSATENPDDDPDLSPLEKDFEILGQSQNNQFSFNNGQSSRSIEWRITVMAKRAGTLDIPPIAFGNDHSERFSVTVTPSAGAQSAPTDAQVFLEVEAEPKRPYVQAQVIYTVRVLSRVQMGEARLSNPEVADALVQRLEGEQQGLVNRNGVQYRLNEIRYAVFPQKSGKLRIEPVRLEAQIPIAGRSGFSPFFNRGQTQRLQSEAVELEVRPVPQEFTGKHWLPAASLALEDSWAGKPPQAASGEPITRTLTVKAEGATVGLLPELTPEVAAAPDNLKRYPDQPALNEEKQRDGIVSQRQEKTALIAAQPGIYRMPALEVPWWNTKTDRMEVAKVPERLLTVLPPAHFSPPEPVQPAPQAAPPSAPVPTLPEAHGAPPVPAQGGKLWFWLTLLFGIGWLATALAWWWYSRQSRRANMVRVQPVLAESQPERRLIASVERACRASDPVAARRALADWAAHRWPGMGTEALEARCGGELGREIAQLNRALYAPGGADWQGAGLWRCFRDYTMAKPVGEGTTSAPELEPLYRL